MISDGPRRGLLVAFIAGEPGMAQRLLAEHTGDGTGHCRVYTAGPQSGGNVWSCWFHTVALEAVTRTPGEPAVSYVWSGQAACGTGCMTRSHRCL